MMVGPPLPPKFLRVARLMPIARRQWLTAAPLSAAALVARPGLRSWAEPPAENLVFAEFTPESQAALQRGTAWLLKTMGRDGGCGVDIGQPADIGCTSLAGLALLAQGNTPVEGAHSREVRELVSFLLQTIDNMPAADITAAERTQLQNKIGRHAHSFCAALALSQALGEGYDTGPTRQRLGRLVDVITQAQTDQGHWGNSSWAPTLGTVMGWVALRGAHFAGFKVQASANRTARHLAGQMNENIGHAAGWMHTLYKNATGIRVLYAMGLDEQPVAQKAMSDVLRLVTQDKTAFSQAGGEEFLAFHLITETMLQKGGRDWQAWYPTVRDKIVDVQNRDGSWTGRHCITSRTFCTAAALLVLSAPNRYLPISQQ